MTLRVFTDGGARGNPGPGACAFVVYEVDGEWGPSTGSGSSVSPAGKLREKRGKFLGRATNNEAEYRAVIEALEWLVQDKKGVPRQARDDIIVNFYLDSVLVVNQLNGLFKIKEAKLRNYLYRVRELEAEIPIAITYVYIPREQNWEADRLVNETLDREMSVR